MKNSEHKYDVAVVGGGLTGVCAALAAAKHRKRVLLVEKYGFLGGLTTAAFHTPWFFPGVSALSGCGAAGSDIIEALVAANGLRHYEHCYAVDPEILKYVLQETLLLHGVNLLFHSQCCSLDKDGDTILSLETYCREGKIRISASAFIDATGQSILGGWSGLPLDTIPSSASYRFVMANVHGGSISEDRKKQLAAKWHSRHPELYPGPCHLDPGIRDGEVIAGIIHISWSGELSPDSISALEVRCPRLVADAEEFLRAEAEEFRFASVLAVPAQIGVPTVRRIQGHPEIGEIPTAARADQGVYDNCIRVKSVENMFLTGREILPTEL
ncbi:MAG: FAD-dependent oxidoreductase, partial [Ignavibacteriales bacterium]|nr:FAD-dependent oxidoreductase [Ignavibacteriales bacterium]